MARPTKYKPSIAKKICELITADTYTVIEICKMVKISPSTYYEWVNRYPEFSNALKKAEEARMDFLMVEAKKSLVKKIQGYTVTENQITTIGSGKYDVNGKEIPKIKEQKSTDKHFQPDTAAIIFTLCNTDPKNWKNQQRTEITGKDGKDLFQGLTDEELDAKIEDLEERLGDKKDK